MKFKKGWQPVSVEGFSEACPICKNDGSDLCFECKMEMGKSGFEPKDGFEPTNADRIRAMSDEELVEFLFFSFEMEFDICLLCEHGNPTPRDDRGQCLLNGVCYGESRAEAFKKWLKQPAEVEKE